MKKLLLVIIVAVLSCKKENTSEPEKEPQSPYTINYGEVINLKSLDLQVGFRDVVEDSRCPTNVVCVWEGIARLNVWMKPSQTDTITVHPSLPGYCWREDTARHVAVDTMGYRITLMQLDPYPFFGDTTHSKSDYRAVVNIVRK